MEKYSQVYKSEKLILLKCSYYPNRSIDSTQSLSNSSALFTEVGKKILRFIWNYNRLPKSQNHFEKKQRTQAASHSRQANLSQVLGKVPAHSKKLPPHTQGRVVTQTTRGRSRQHVKHGLGVHCRRVCKPAQPLPENIKKNLKWSHKRSTNSPTHEGRGMESGVCIPAFTAMLFKAALQWTDLKCSPWVNRKKI